MSNHLIGDNRVDVPLPLLVLIVELESLILRQLDIVGRGVRRILGPREVLRTNSLPFGRFPNRLLDSLLLLFCNRPSHGGVHSSDSIESSHIKSLAFNAEQFWHPTPLGLPFHLRHSRFWLRFFLPGVVKLGTLPHVPWLLRGNQIFIRLHVFWNNYFLTYECLIFFRILVLSHKVPESSLLLLFGEFVLEFNLLVDLLFANWSILRLFEIHIIQTTSVFSLRGLLRFKCLRLLNMVVEDV